MRCGCVWCECASLSWVCERVRDRGDCVGDVLFCRRWCRCGLCSLGGVLGLSVLVCECECWLGSGVGLR